MALGLFSDWPPYKRVYRDGGRMSKLRITQHVAVRRLVRERRCGRKVKGERGRGRAQESARYDRDEEPPPLNSPPRARAVRGITANSSRPPALSVPPRNVTAVLKAEPLELVLPPRF